MQPLNNFSLKDALLGPGSKAGNKYSLGNDGTTLIDGDTFVRPITGDDGKPVIGKDGKPAMQSVRLGGIDTSETTKVIKDENTGFDTFQPGGLLGQIDHDYVYNVAKDGGFTNFVKGVGKTHGRDVGDLANEKGELLTNTLIRSGAYRPTSFSSEAQRGIGIAGELDRSEQEADGTLLTDDQINIRAKNSYEGRLRERLGFDLLAPVALNEAEYARGLNATGRQTSYAQGVVQTRSKDRTLTNETKNWGLKGRWNRGVNNLKQGGAGGLLLSGDILDSDWLSQWGSDSLNELKLEASKAPELKGNRLFNDKGDWDIEGVGEFVNTSAKLGVESAPYIGAALASAWAGAQVGALAGSVVPGAGNAAGAAVGAAAGFVAGVLPLSFVYAGDAYNGQEFDPVTGKKDPVRAILSGVAQASVDRLALPGAFKKVDIFSKIGGKRVIDFLMKDRKITRDAATKLLGKTTAGQASAALKAAGYVTAQFGKGALKEAPTEAIQEALGVWGEKKDLDWNDAEVRERIITGAVAGGALGGPLNVAFEGVAKGKAGYENYKVDWANSGIDQESLAHVVKTEDENQVLPGGQRRGYLRDTTELVRDIKNTVVEGANNLDVTASKGERTFFEKIKAIPGLYFQEALVHGIKPLEQASSIVRDLGSSLGINNFRAGPNLQTHGDSVFSAVAGRELFDTKTFEATTGEKVVDLKNIYNDPVQVENDVELIMQGQVPVGNYTSGQLSFLQSTADAQRTLRNEGSKAGVTDTTSLLAPTINRRALHSQRRAIAASITKGTSLSSSEVNTVLNRILDPTGKNVNEGDTIAVNDEVRKIKQDTNEVISLLKSDARFNGVLNTDPISNINANARVASNRFTDNMFIGQNGEVIAKQLDLAVQQGQITEKEAAVAAAQISKALQLRDAPNRIDDQLLRKTHDFGSFAASVSYLTLATLSSIPELAFNLSHRNDDGKRAWKAISNSVKDKAAGMRKDMAEVTANSEKNIPPEYQRGLLQHLGFLDKSHSVARRHDAQALSPQLQAFQDKYFKAIGLESWTNWNRGLRASMGHDAIKDYAMTYGAQLDASEGKGNKGSEEARQKLLELGVDPNVVLNYFNLVEGRSEAEAIADYVSDSEGALSEVDAKELFEGLKAEFQDNLRLGSIAFVNQGMVNPSVLNRPLWYSDPRFVLFSKFNGFLSAFTAKLLPQLLKGVNPVSGVSPQERVQAIRTIAGMIALGLLAFNLKLAVKGEDEDDLKYLQNDVSKVRAKFAASGLAGTAERPLNFILPMFGGSPLTGEGYGANSAGGEAPSNVVQDAWSWLNRRKDDVVGESPVLGLAEDAAGVVKDVFDDEPFNTSRALGITPFGSLTKKHFGGDNDLIGDVFKLLKEGRNV